MIYSMVGGMIAVQNVTRPYQEITITFDALVHLLHGIKNNFVAKDVLISYTHLPCAFDSFSASRCVICSMV
jgi:hypothetical protein